MVIESIAAFGSITGAFKSATDLIKAITDARDDSTIKAKANELQAQIFSAQQSALTAQTAQFTLLDRVGELEKTIANFEAWETEKQRYQLHNIDRGVFAYVLKKDMSNGEPPHWLCARCYTEGKKSLLQISTQPRMPGLSIDATKWICSTCTAAVGINYTIFPTFLDEGKHASA